MTEPSACGWCGSIVYDWSIDGAGHRWGACVDLIDAWRREYAHLLRHRRYGRQEARLRELRELLSGITS